MNLTEEQIDAEEESARQDLALALIVVNRHLRRLSLCGVRVELAFRPTVDDRPRYETHYPQED